MWLLNYYITHQKTFPWSESPQNAWRFTSGRREGRGMARAVAATARNLGMTGMIPALTIGKHVTHPSIESGMIPNWGKWCYIICHMMSYEMWVHSRLAGIPLQFPCRGSLSLIFSCHPGSGSSKKVAPWTYGWPMGTTCHPKRWSSEDNPERW